jgi:phenylacetate-CoA ligase
MDAMTVRVERRTDADPVVAAHAGRALEELVKNTIGVSVTVDVVNPEKVERSMGKMRRIVDQRARGR